MKTLDILYLLCSSHQIWGDGAKAHREEAALPKMHNLKWQNLPALRQLCPASLLTSACPQCLGGGQRLGRSAGSLCLLLFPFQSSIRASRGTIGGYFLAGRSMSWWPVSGPSSLPSPRGGSTSLLLPPTTDSSQPLSLGQGNSLPLPSTLQASDLATSDKCTIPWAPPRYGIRAFKSSEEAPELWAVARTAGGGRRNFFFQEGDTSAYSKERQVRRISRNPQPPQEIHSKPSQCPSLSHQPTTHFPLFSELTSSSQNGMEGLSPDAEI